MFLVYHMLTQIINVFSYLLLITPFHIISSSPFLERRRSSNKICMKVKKKKISIIIIIKLVYVVKCLYKIVFVNFYFFIYALTYISIYIIELHHIIIIQNFRNIIKERSAKNLCCKNINYQNNYQI